jgi:heavy metal translocating P-type ATPase
MTEIAPQSLIDPTSGTTTVEWSLVHSVPGRDRIRIPFLGQGTTFATHLRHLVSELTGVSGVRLNPFAQSLIIEYDLDSLGLNQPLTQLDAVIQQAHQRTITQFSLQDKNSVSELLTRLPWERLGWSSFSLFLSLLFLPLEWPPLAIVTGVVIMTTAMPIFAKAVQELFLEGKPTGALQESFWIAINTLRGEFLEPALSLSLNSGGETLREMTRREASPQQSLAKFVQQLEDRKQVRAFKQDLLETIPWKDLNPGDVIVVYAGEMILADGVILEGTALIDQSSLTGESEPVVRRPKQQVYAGTVIIEGRLHILAQEVRDCSRAGLAIALTQTAPLHDTRIADYASQISDTLILPILLFSGGFALAGDWSRAGIILTLDCAKGTELSVPTTMLAALRHAHDEGIYISSGRDLELLAKADTIVFDKTGTLTHATSKVQSIEAYGDQVTIKEVLVLAASLELGNPHPIARAIQADAQAQGITPEPCQNWVYHNGLGITADIQGQPILVGNLRLLHQQGVDLEQLDRHCPHLKQSDLSHLYIVRNGLLLGTIAYQGLLRPHSAEVVSILKAQGKSVYIMTGDHPKAAYATAASLGISRDWVYPDLLPDQKSDLVRQFQDQGKIVAYVGDGINDCSALAYADVSITLMDSSDIAHEVADVVLLENDLRDLVIALKIGREAMDLVYQNTAIVTLPNIGAVGAALFLGLDPSLAVLISDGANLLAELNSFRALSDDLLPGAETSVRSEVLRAEF